MNRIRFRALPLLVLFLGLGPGFFPGMTKSAAGAEVCVAAATGAGAPSSLLVTVTDLVRSAVGEAGSSVLSPEGGASCAITLRPKVIKLDAATLLSIEKWEENRMTFSTQLKAARTDELDRVAQRVVRAVLSETAAREDVKVNDVTEDEATHGVARRPARSGYFASFGPAWLSELNATGLGVGISGGYAWDVNRVILQLQADFATHRSALWTVVGIGGRYFLGSSDLAPYLSGEFGYGFAKRAEEGLFTGKNTTGFALGGGVGLHLLRTTIVNLGIGVRTTILLSEIDGAKPMATAAEVSLYF
jgi:hypothetical protein